MIVEIRDSYSCEIKCSIFISLIIWYMYICSFHLEVEVKLKYEI